jgi:NAD(P)-dependent dehydrogenase (short-subunit alcohol dehydrogenase family)
VVLVTGGTGGIIGEVCRDLAAPGVRLVLVGRGPAGDGMSPERRARLDALRAAGAELEYHSVDVRCPKPFGAFIDGLYDRFGRIDAVVHGAGVIDDRRFDTKTAEAFDRIFDTKADSTIVLARHLRPASLRWIVLFGSVSGRFGNRGQADYAAANETLNRVAWSLRRRWPRTRVVAINWGPWRGTGMMGDATLMLLTARGIQPIEVEAGRRFFLDELRLGGLDDVEVVAGGGPWPEEARRAGGEGSPPVGQAPAGRTAAST